MSAPGASRPWRILARDHLVAVVLAGGLFVVFAVANVRLLHGFSGTEVLLLEVGAVVLVAFLVARAVANATNAVLRRHGLIPRGHAVRLFLNVLIATGTALALSKLAGVSAESIFIGAGFTGIVLGLAAHTVLSNVFAGMLLVFADPFRPGDHVGIVAGPHGLLPPSYPHEPVVPMYSGTVEDVGLTYTLIALDTVGMAKLPNGVVIQTLVVLPRGAVLHRVRVTFPRAVRVSAVEGAMAQVASEFPPPSAGVPGPRLEVTDLSASTGDGVVVLWSLTSEPGVVRDRAMRAVLARVDPPAVP